MATNNRKGSRQYKRPWLEIEYDQKRLNEQGCCRFVPVTLRIGDIPVGPRLTVLTTRESRETAPSHLSYYSQHSKNKDTYDITPISRGPSGSDNAFPAYYEVSFLLLARDHTRETGTFAISLVTHAGTELSSVEYRLDCREHEPIMQGQAKGFTSIEVFPSIRSKNERDAFRGRRDASVVQESLQFHSEDRVLEQ